ncbi:MAG: hydroxyacid dehydrogenase [Armatimonadota bacterium]
MLKGIFILDTGAYDRIYGDSERNDISSLVDIYVPQQTPQSIRENPEIINEADIIFSGWGGPHIDVNFLKTAPNLKAVFYGAGSIKGIVSDAFWDRGILISSAYGANAVPVAEYTVSQIIFCLKSGWHYASSTRRNRNWKERFPVPGTYRSTVGIISLGMVGKHVCRLLKSYDLKVLAYDPFVSEQDALDLGVELCSLDEIFERSDVVSLHTPLLKETEGMITGRHLASMKQYSSFINTSRGAVIRECEMIEVLQDRPDIQAVLDVTHPEPPVPDSPLYKLPNVVLTPHIAGCQDEECKRMGRCMVDELKLFLDGKPLKWGITRERVAILA